MTNASLALMSKTIQLPSLLFKIQVYLAIWTTYGPDVGSVTALSIHNTGSQKYCQDRATVGWVLNICVSGSSKNWSGEGRAVSGAWARGAVQGSDEDVGPWCKIQSCREYPSRVIRVTITAVTINNVHIDLFSEWAELLLYLLSVILHLSGITFSSAIARAGFGLFSVGFGTVYD